MKKQSIAANIIWSIANLIISTIITMLLLPYVSEKIGIEAYGYSTLCNNIITYIDLIASTVNVYAIRFISIAYHSGDLNKANRYYSSILAANILFSMILLFPATVCVVYISKLLKVSEILTVEIQLLFILTLVNYIITMLGVVFSSAAFIKDILYKDTKIRMEGQIIRGIILLVLFASFYPHVWFLSIATIFSSLYIVMRNVRVTRQYLPELQLNKKFVSIKLVMEIASNGIWNSVASLGTILNSGIDLLVTNWFLGSIKMGQLSVPKTLSGFVTRLLVSISDSYRPQLLMFYTKNEKMKLALGLTSAMHFCGLITCTIFSVFCVVGRTFFDLWLPTQNTKIIYQLSVLTFLAEIFTGYVRPLHYGCVLTGKLKIPCLWNLAVGGMNAVSMIVLLTFTDWDIYIVVLTTVIGNIVYNFIIMPIYVTKILGFIRGEFYLSIAKYIIVCFIITGITISIGGVFPNTNGWLLLGVKTSCCTAAAMSMYIFLMLDRSEKQGLAQAVKKWTVTKRR